MISTQEEETIQKVAEDLGQLLSDTYILYLKTQNYHWNVEDPRFEQLHKLFENEYKELADQVDEIAERIRMIGKKAPGTMKDFLANTSLKEARPKINGDEMIKDLAFDHQTISKWLQSKIDATVSSGDQGTADMYIQHLKAHEKQSWMLLSHKGKLA